MNEELFTAVLALAWFGAVNLAASAAAAGLAWLMERGVVRLPASAEPGALLGVKLLPGAVALLFTALVFLPAHWRFEPEGADETAGYTLAAFAALGALTLVAAGARGAARVAPDRARWNGRGSSGPSARAASLPARCRSTASRTTRPSSRWPGCGARACSWPAWCIDVFSADELDVSLAHELAHCDARDNLKRVLVACSPDLLGLWPAGRDVERRWRAAVEFAADARAVNGSEDRAVSLASALLKIARLAPASGAACTGSGFYDGTLLWARIDRLLGPAALPHSPRPARVALRVCVCGMTAVGAVLAAEGAWFGVHLVTEGLVRLLP